MPDTPQKPQGQLFARVRLKVADQSDMGTRFAKYFQGMGLFIQSSKAPPVGSMAVVEFVQPNGSCLSRCVAELVRVKKDGDAILGMELSFTELDDVAKEARGVDGTCETTAVRLEPSVSSQVDAVQRVTSITQKDLRPRMLTLTGPVVGIDLGTSNSCVAIGGNDAPQVIVSPSGYNTIPSVVHLGASGERLVGHPARERMIMEPAHAIYASKRFLGRPFASREVKNLGHFFTYELVCGPKGCVAAKVEDEVVPLEEVAAHILGLLKHMAEHYLQQSVQRAVITVPAYFGETQRQAVRDAGSMAGLYVERVLNEPTAAAVTYGFGRGLHERVLVYDLGGGTFDVALLKIDDDRVEVVGADGDPFLGGADFDDRLTEYALMMFERNHGINLRSEPVAVQRVRFAAEMAKKQLSEVTTTIINLPYVAENDAGPVAMNIEVTRDTYENLTRDLVERTLSIAQRMLDAAQVRGDYLDDIILVGGQTRSPAVHRAIIERFSRKPCKQVHPDEAIALGAAIVANGIQEQKPIDLTDVLSASVRMIVDEKHTMVLLGRGAPLPAEHVLVIDLMLGQETQIGLCRGEAEGACDNAPLGVLMIPKAPHGQAQAEITFVVNHEGLLSVSAVNHSSGQTAELDVLLI